jgi:subtilase family serine protease
MFRRFVPPSLTIPAFVLALSCTASAQTPALITSPINEANLVTLAGNTRPEANAANDLGRVSDDLAMPHMLLQLQRSPQQDAALDDFIQQLNNPKSSNYHQWLTASQFGARFGLAQNDLIAISGWLQSHGFTVDTVYTGGMSIDFSGTAGQVRNAFHTEIHNLSVGGQAHIANMSDPKIPAALAPAVAGVVSLHNFMPHPMYVRKPEYTVAGTSTSYLVTPQDVATIYNFNPEFAAKITGTGQTIVVVEDTNLYSTADWTTFRTTFGLTRFTGATLTQVHPASTGTNNCSNPGTNGDSFEAAVDVEYATAAAPSAAIELASCSDTSTFGGLIALNNLVNASTTPPAIVSVSYGECEAVTGASANAAFKSVYSHAATEGVSVYVASGDTAADSCAQALGESVATTGTSVTGWGSTPYNVAVGGTDFQDLYLNDFSTYWNSTNTTYYGSAKSYMPEIPWNDTCGSNLLATYEGFTTTYGSTGLCNTDGFIGTNGGGGGQSACATGAPAVSGVTGGTCKGYAKPSWQSVYGNKADGVRDVPDVSLFASNGWLSSYYVVCYSDKAAGGTACTGAPSGWSGAGGTSFATPIMAGVQALINQKTGARQGLPNTALYALAAAEYGTTGATSCNSELGNGVASTCTFHDVTEGSIDLPCTGTYTCYDPSGTYGVLSASDSTYKPTFQAAPGWDFASGIGSVNVANLVNNWSTVAP